MSVSTPVYVAIGIPPERGDFVPPEKAGRIIKNSRVFSGGRRHFEKVRRFLPPSAEWIEIGGDIEKTLGAYDRRVSEGKTPVVIFASGDPLFYGIGSTIRRMRPDCEIEVFHAPSSIEALCARAGTVWTGAAASVHGRDWHELDRALIAGEQTIGLLTDSENSPAAAAQRMIEYGFSGYRCVTGERLGEPDERVRRMTAGKMARESFAQPCAVLMQKSAEDALLQTDAEDALFETLPGRPGMITKPAARRAAVERLRLESAERMWDIGFCTGSVAVEARRRFAGLRVTAFEKNPECGALIKENARRFSAPGIRVIMEDFFEASADALPAPDAVFIGGHGGRLGEMMDILGKIMRTGGRIVLNSVTEESGKTFRERAAEAGFEFEAPETAGNIEVLSAVRT